MPFHWARYLIPSDAVYIISIVVGLFALVFLEEVPIRLIGACVVLLSGVFLVINLQTRMRDKIAWSRPTVSQPVELTKRVRTSPDGTTRIVFDDFATTFSGDDEHATSSATIETSGTANGNSQRTTKPSIAQREQVLPPERVSTSPVEIGDDFSSVRVVRKVSKQGVQKPTVEHPAAPEPTSSLAGEPTAPRIRHVQLSLATLIDESFESDATEPRREFAHIIKGILHILRSTMNARTAAYFWYNPDRRELVLEAIISDVTDSIRNQRKFPLGEDILSHIVQGGQAQIVCDIRQSAECDLLPYYYQATGTKSLAAVPVFLHKTVVGILTVDSPVDDAYDEQTVGILGQCGRLISMLVQSYTTKYDLQQHARTLETIVHFRRLFQHGECSVTDIAQALVQAATALVETRGAGVVLFDTESGQWTLVAAVGSSMPPVGTIIEVTDTAIAATLLEGKIVQCHHCKTLQRRYASAEQSSQDGYFVAVPLRSANENYGALVVESTNERIAEQDIAALEILGEHAGMLIAQIVLSVRVREQSLMDDHTQTYNVGAFHRRLAEEIERAHDARLPLSLLLFQLDRYKTLEQQPVAYESLVETTVEIIRSLLKPYHIVGRLDRGLIGVMLPGLMLDKSQSLADHIRRKIAATPQTIEGRTVVVTVSVGVAPAENVQTVESALQNAMTALHQALRRTNTVVVYS